MAQELKFNLLLIIKPPLLHYLPRNTKHKAIMAKSAFTDDLLLTLSNHQDALQGLWGQSMALKSRAGANGPAS